MTSSSDPKSRAFAPGASGMAKPAGEAAGAGPLHARFIPREEIDSFSAWKLSAFGDVPAHDAADAPPPPPPPSLPEQLRAAREGGYHDGYRDGLAALDSFKQSHATQVAAQVGAVISGLHAQLDALQRDLAQRVAGVALDIARQVVRTDLHVASDLVVAVTQEALDELLASARNVTVHLHPHDRALVGSACAQTLSERGARLVDEPQMQRGGCIVQSDVSVVDAQVSTRCQRAAAAMGLPAGEAP
jgi:flagellar assembly protein FliH